MARWEIKQCNSCNEALAYLNGDLVGAKNLYAGADVDGLTFIVDVGTGDTTVTFAPALSRPWTLDEIVAQINATLTDLAVGTSVNEGIQQVTYAPDRRLKLINGGTLKVDVTGTANVLLGFSGTVDTTGDPVADTELINSSPDGDLNRWAFLVYR